MCAFGFSSATVRAQTQEDRTIALGLFEQGRKLRAEARFSDAAGKFEAASKLMRTYGVLLNLAECYEKLGRSASAWSTWREAEFVARSQHHADDESYAAKRVRELEPQLSYLTLSVARENRQSDLAITRNGTPVPTAAWSSPIPIDPGPQHIEARAAGFRTWQTQLVLGDRADRQAIQIPMLDVEGTAAPVAIPTAKPNLLVGVTAPASNATESSPPPSHRSAVDQNGTSKWLGPSIGAAGIVTAVVGVVIWKTGQSKVDDAITQATQAINDVDRGRYNDAGSDLSSGKNQRTAGIVTTCVGAALAGTGLTLFLLAPKSAAPKIGQPRANAWFDRHGGGVSLATRF